MPRPFHVYSMQQAIEEGYILDVLRNYTTYDTAFKIAQRSKPHLTAVKLIDESEATKGLMRWVSLHPTNIAQKVQIIVEHYRTNVRHLLDGHAKAMVVTSSREHAVRYKEAIDAYIAKQGYKHRRPGRVLRLDQRRRRDLRQGRAAVHGDQSEPRPAGWTLPVAFGTDEFAILIVANKYQTGLRPAPAVRHVRGQAAVRCDGGADAVPAEPDLRGGRERRHLHSGLRQRP